MTDNNDAYMEIIHTPVSSKAAERLRLSAVVIIQYLYSIAN